MATKKTSAKSNEPERQVALVYTGTQQITHDEYGVLVPGEVRYAPESVAKEMLKAKDADKNALFAQPE